MKKLVYNSAPLPFMGQKRRFVGEFKKALGLFPNATVFVDLFGGSGLLSHVAKQERPDVQVVYNDFDDFHLRLQNIPRTNALLADIRNFVGGGNFQEATTVGGIAKANPRPCGRGRKNRVCRLYYPLGIVVVLWEICDLIRRVGKRWVLQYSSAN